MGGFLERDAWRSVRFTIKGREAVPAAPAEGTVARHVRGRRWTLATQLPPTCHRLPKTCQHLPPAAKTCRALPHLGCPTHGVLRDWSECQSPECQSMSLSELLLGLIPKAARFQSGVARRSGKTRSPPRRPATGCHIIFGASSKRGVCVALAHRARGYGPDEERCAARSGGSSGCMCKPNYGG